MKRSPVFLYKVKQVLTLTGWWVLIGILMELHNAVNYDPASQRHFLYFIFGRSAAEHLLITAIGPLLGGVLAGSFIIFYQRDKLKGRTYGQQLLIHSLLYLLFVSTCIVIVGAIGAFNNPGDSSFLQNFYQDVFSLRVLRLLIAWYVVVILSIFLLDVSERYGPGTLWKSLRGKYYKPGREERVFMFLDLRSSTTIAEKIGEERFFRMLHHFFQLANEAILNWHGEIYQYVGDEIVVSWEGSKGLSNGNCLQCFMEVRNIVQQNAGYFTAQFGVVPEFKAAIHTGVVATGEIGTVKKDIVYSGDVLNTTARMVALCNQYGESLIISQPLYEAVKHTPGFHFSYLDSPELRGKTIKLGLYGVSAIPSA